MSAKEIVLCLLLLVACALISAGTWLISVPAAWITGGVLLAGLSFVVLGEDESG